MVYCFVNPWTKEIWTDIVSSSSTKLTNDHWVQMCWWVYSARVSTTISTLYSVSDAQLCLLLSVLSRRRDLKLIVTSATMNAEKVKHAPDSSLKLGLTTHSSRLSMAMRQHLLFLDVPSPSRFSTPNRLVKIMLTALWSKYFRSTYLFLLEIFWCSWLVKKILRSHAKLSMVRIFRTRSELKSDSLF